MTVMLSQSRALTPVQTMMQLKADIDRMDMAPSYWVRNTVARLGTCHYAHAINQAVASLEKARGNALFTP